MSEPEKSSGSVHSSEMQSSTVDSRPVKSSSSSGSGGGGDPDDPGGGDSSGPGDGDCPTISGIYVQVTRVGDHEPPDDLCFAEDVLTGCGVIVGFVVGGFSEACGSSLIARVMLATGSRTIAVFPVGGFYQVEWGDGVVPDLDLFAATTYTVTICIEATVGTPEECDIPEDCCETIQWTSPPLCCCNPYEDGTTCGDLPCCCEPNWAPVGPDCACEYVGP